MDLFVIGDEARDTVLMEEKVMGLGIKPVGVGPENSNLNRSNLET